MQFFPYKFKKDDDDDEYELPWANLIVSDNQIQAKWNLTIESPRWGKNCTEKITGATLPVLIL